MEILNGEASILDSLETSLIGVSSSSEIKEEKVFNVKIDLLEDGKEIDRINAFYNSTRQSMHACNHLKIKSIYTVEIGHIKSNYESNPITENIMELWHGTSKSHLLSILKSGLKIPNGKGAVLNGANFGYGIYMSDQSTKSLNYSHGYWSGTRDNNCFMFLCDAKMGKILYPRYTDGLLHQKLNGHDSVWCKPSNVSTLANNEMIVYKESQCNLKYLCEFH
jgi:poly [ADP-ribose] polymerase